MNLCPLVNRIAAAFCDVNRPARIVGLEIGVENISLARKYYNISVDKIKDVTSIAGSSCEDLYHMTPESAHYFIQTFMTYLAERSEGGAEIGVVLGFVDYLDSTQTSVTYPPFSEIQVKCICDLLELINSRPEIYGLEDGDDHLIRLPDLIKCWTRNLCQSPQSHISP